MASEKRKTLKLLYHASGWCSKSKTVFAALKKEAEQQKDLYCLAFRFDGSGSRYAINSNQSLNELISATKQLNSGFVDILYWAEKNAYSKDKDDQNIPQLLNMMPMGYEVPRTFIYSFPQFNSIPPTVQNLKGAIVIQGAENVFKNLIKIMTENVIFLNMNGLNSLDLLLQCYRVELYYNTTCHHLKMYQYDKLFDDTKSFCNDFIYGLVDFSSFICDDEKENEEFKKARKLYTIKELPCVCIVPSKLYKISNKFKVDKLVEKQNE